MLSLPTENLVALNGPQGFAGDERSGYEDKDHHYAEADDETFLVHADSSQELLRGSVLARAPEYQHVTSYHGRNGNFRGKYVVSTGGAECWGSGV
jgi:hypothetical protein